MGKKIAVTVILMMALGFLPSCARKPQSPWEAYYPVNIGNEWTYENSVGSRTVTLTQKIAGTGRVEGVKCYVMDFVRKDENAHKIFLSLTPDGIYLNKRINEGREEMVLNPPRPMLLYPLTPGKWWDWEGKVSPDTRARFRTVVVGEEEVTVPAGKFTALRIDIKRIDSFHNEEEHSSRWLVKDVGVVKEGTIDGFLSQLVKARVNGRVIGQ
jgi:hypothetical protein